MAELATAVVVTDAAGMVVIWNQAATKLFGRDAADALGRSAAKLLLPPEFQLDAVAVVTSVAGGRRWIGEVDCKRKDGSLVPTNVTLSAVYDEARTVIGFVGEARDRSDVRAAEDQTRDTERLFRSLLLRTAELVYVADAHGIFKFVLPTVESPLGYSADELTGTSAFDISHPDDVDHIRDVFAALVADPTMRPTITYRAKGKDGSWHWRENRLSNFIDDPILAGIVCNVRDVTDQHDLLAELRAADARQRAIVARSHDLTLFCDPEGMICWASPIAPELLGASPEALVGRHGLDFIVAEDRERVATEFAAMMEPGAHVRAEFRIVDPAGATRWVEEDVTNLVDDPDVGYVVCNLRDITDRKRAQDQREHLALYDQLTGLPNRSLVVNRLEQLLVRGGAATVLHIDVDNLGDVNDALGHDAGDDLLRLVGKRFTGALAQFPSTLAKLGSDQFVVLCDGVDDTAAALDIAERLRASLIAPIGLNHEDVVVTASIGVALSPGDATSLMHDAATATGQAKAQGRDRVVMFDASLEVTHQRRLVIQSELRHALLHDEFVVWYQPIVDLKHDRVVGVEALVRWDHPRRGLLLPDQFLDVAESSGLIRSIGSQVLGKVFADARVWQKQGRRFGVSFNVAAAQLSSPDFVTEIETALNQYELDRAQVTIELTETAAMQVADVRDTLERIRLLGIQLALDDFGTGYSSISFLRDLPVNAIKIDRSFINGLGREANDTSIVEGLIAMAAAVGYAVTAEGVETIEQAELLQVLGCRYAQGFLWARAVPAREIDEVASRLDGAVFSGEPEPLPKLRPSIEERVSASLRRHARQVLAGTTAFIILVAALALRIDNHESRSAAAPMGYQVATIADTNFAIPAGSLFVANDGSDTKSGSLAAPFATIRKALTAAPTGGTVVVRGGTYRESLGAIKQNVTLQAYPHEQVWVKGSIVVHGFTANAGRWSLPFTSTACNTCYPTTALDPRYPAAGLPEQVFVDGAPADQVVSQTDLAPNTFFVDRTTNKLWLYDNPTGHNVEVTVLDKAFGINPAAPGTAIKGIGFEHWAAVYEGGINVAGMSSAANVTFDSDTFAWSSSRGLGIYASNNVVKNSQFVNNGMNGVSSTAVDRLDFERNEVAFSNYEHWSILPMPSAQMAGVKVNAATNTILRGNDVHDNFSNGLWVDELSSYPTIVNNKVQRNAGHGVILEITGHSVVVGNLIADNGRDGLKIAGANDVEVWNNTVAGNGWAQIGVYEDPRQSTGAATSDTTNVRIANNIFQAGLDSASPVLNSFDTSTPKHLTTLRMISVDDHNDYGRTSEATPQYLMSTQSTLAERATYRTLADFGVATGRELASTTTDGWAPTALFVDPTAGNYALQPGVSESLATPTTLPAAVAAKLGGPATPTYIGAFAEVPRDVGVIPPYQVATIDVTNYAIPAGARYVATNGNDANPGSLGLPYATIRKALTATPTGGTVVVRGGTYRESLGSISHKVTVQAYPHEQPWVKGSVVANDFAAGSGGWSIPFTPMCANCYPNSEIDPASPAAGLPEQVFVDGAPLQQVMSKGALSAKSFYVDRGANKLWLHDDPAGHAVEVTKLARAFGIGSSAAGSAIRGVGFEHWATVYERGTNVAGMSSASNVTFDHDTFAWSSSRALGIFGANNVVTNSHFVDNGMNAVNAHKVNNLDFERNEVAFSNIEHWSITPSPLEQIGGAKITHTTNTVMRGNVFHDNFANALWFDQVAAYQTVVDNTIVRNAGHGLEIEVSGHSIVAGNMLAENGRDGIKLSGANDVEVWNNTVVDNGWAQIGIYEDPRHTTGAATSDTTNVRLGNNIFHAGANSTKYLLYSFDNSNPKHFTTVQMLSADDHNDYGRTNVDAPKLMFSIQLTLTKQATFLTLPAFHAATGRSRASTTTDGWSLTRMFVDPANGNYTLRSGVSDAMAAPARLPTAVQNAMGGPAVPEHLGV